jgi:type II secretory pathway pseudopilin PulG
MNRSEQGFIYLWAMFAVTVAGIVLAGTGQTWQIKAQREKELELLFVGEEFRAAIMSYYNGAQGGGAREYPDSLEQLLEDKRGAVPIRHLRKIYLDPMTKTLDWGLVEEPAPEDESGATRSNINSGIIGVHSRSKKTPMKKENFPEHFAKFSEAETYQDWQFVYTQDGDGNQTQQQNQQKPDGSQPSSSSPFASQSSSTSSSSSSPSPFASQSGQGGQGSQSGQGSASPFASPR